MVLGTCASTNVEPVLEFLLETSKYLCSLSNISFAYSEKI